MKKTEKSKPRFCVKCKINQKLLECGCCEKIVTLKELVKKYHKNGETSTNILGKIKNEGFDVSSSMVYHAFKKLGYITIDLDASKRIEVRAYVKSLKLRPTSKSVSNDMGCSDSTAYNAIFEVFGSKRKRKLADFEKIYIKNCLEIYKNWEENKTFPTPYEVVEVIPLLKTHSLI